ncbi:MAG TPA: hydroxyacid dehydrogenase [Oscillospiraceae bacterium]|nr:hydroxyacid dehydrogenase [Oscillospiraceae bacterium]HPF56835.1 hydroxyacid dehydrogenase [Clostridiales bacterium]HPK35254.1 hydroxyacid dehydrogenase [Oscillospiraceae bacterium]HPR75447.1 hydroxyacid dehydrogenase [Oscillospiraceae bacterium]
MNIVLLFPSNLISTLFSPDAVTRLVALGTVINHADSADVADADILITSWGSPAVGKEILDRCPNLRLVAHAAGSVKPVVTEELWERGVRVTNAAKALGIGVAETALGLTICTAKNIFTLNANIHNGGWDEGREDVRELYNLTVGVLGSGRAGGHYIKLLQNFSVRVLCYDPYLSDEKAAALGCEKASLEEVLKNSDVISVHAPSIEATHHMLNADTLKLMKKDAVLINTARGTIIDERALYDHMAAGNLRYACLDVFDPEPPEAENSLRKLPNCILTPHLAGLVNNGRQRIGMHITQEIERFVRSGKLDCEVFQKDLEITA